MLTVSSPVVSVPALPADLTEVSVEPLGSAVGVSRVIPGSYVESTKIGPALCLSDDMDVTPGALARQLGSSSAAVPHEGEDYPALEMLSRKAESSKGLLEGLVESFRSRLHGLVVSCLVPVAHLVLRIFLQFPNVVSIVFGCDVYF